MAIELEPYIDAHSHIWTPDVEHYPLARGFQVAEMAPKSFTAEQLLAICRPSGVGRVNLIQMSWYEFDNRYILDMIALYPDRFVGTAIIDPLAPAAEIERSMKELDERGVRAFRIQPRYSKLPPARWLEPEGYATMFRTAAKLGQALSCLIDPDGFPEVDRMCRRFPETSVIIDHFGRIGVTGTIDPRAVDALTALAAHPRLTVKVGAFYALGKKTPPYLDLGPMIHAVVDAYGSKRCMWESDCPFQVDAHRYSDSVELIEKRLPFLTAADRRNLLHETAKGLLFSRPRS
ncbi:MAG: amidohydrolase family protein [Isosphaeraceae bacterium]|nr:amidohydrolase family protein [Isosphaeraceae bacterium]